MSLLEFFSNLQRLTLFIAYNIAGNNADNKVVISDSSALYNIARSCGLDPHTGIRLNPERASI